MGRNKYKFFIQYSNIDDLVKSRNSIEIVIPAKAGIQLNQAVLGSRLRGSDGFSDFLRVHQYSYQFKFLKKWKKRLCLAPGTWNPLALVIHLSSKN